MFRFSKLENKNIFIIFLYKLLTKITLYFSDLYTVSSLSDFKFVNNKFNNVDIEIRPNWISVDGNSAPNDTCFYNIISVGRLEEQKNYREAILALKDFDYIFTIYGEGSQKEMLLKLAKDKKVNLTIKNIIRNSELMKVYKNNNIFISTSEYEGNSKVILEAMASGCLVIAKEIDNNVELIDHGRNGYLYKDLKDLKRILSNIQKNQSDQMIVKSNAVKKVIRNNSFEVLVKKEKLDYSKLI